MTTLFQNQIIYFLKRKQKFKNRIDAQFFGGTRVIFLNIRLWTKAPTSALQGGSYACCRNTLWGQLKAFPSNSSFLPQIPFFSPYEMQVFLVTGMKFIMSAVLSPMWTLHLPYIYAEELCTTFSTWLSHVCWFLRWLYLVSHCHLTQEKSWH